MNVNRNYLHGSHLGHFFLYQRMTMIAKPINNCSFIHSVDNSLPTKYFDISRYLPFVTFATEMNPSPVLLTRMSLEGEQREAGVFTVRTADDLLVLIRR